MRCLHTILIAAFAIMSMMALVACGGADGAGRQRVDQLNDKAYQNYYVDADSIVFYAQEALGKLGSMGAYPDGRDEALCHLGFAKYMTMDYDSASVCLRQVLDHSSNELYRLWADIVMMKICQRRSVNNAFYDYHNDALRKMGRIRPETAAMTDRQRKYWNYAQSDYHLTLYVYYYYLRQEADAAQELRFLEEHEALIEDDVPQRLMYLFLLGNAKNVDNRLTDSNTANLMEAAAEAKAYGLNYIMAKALTSVAEDLMRQTDYRPSRVNFIRELIDAPDSVDNESLPICVCEFALKKFRDYGSLFDVAQTYNTMSEFYISVGQNEDALNAMQKALDCVNEHHQRVAHDNDRLLAFSDSGLIAGSEPLPEMEMGQEHEFSRSTEMKWIADSVVCLPEWMADIREHFCIAYSAMGMKPQSDYNRNIFLDIKEITRQDKKMEQLLDTLKKEQADLNKSMLLAAVLLLLLAAIVAYFARKLKSNYMRNFIKEQKAVEAEMRRWREKTDIDFSNLEEHQEMAIAERFSKEKRLEQQKRQYINKATCLSIVYAITPFLDRTVNEVRKINEEIHGFMSHGENAVAYDDGDNGQRIKSLIDKRLQYVSELIERINVYNDILSFWIKIRQGEVALNIENFELQPLFDILKTNVRSFKAKGIDLRVTDTANVVKADRALTLFMMNTLLENARKYSFSGGTVDLFTDETDDYVEVSVKDQGRGMSQEDVNTIIGEKVYDSAKIGDADNDEELRRNKGFGFGLLNCKGIIEKYRKTNALFSVCKFGIESQLGKGSRFYFRLPKGLLRKSLTIALLCLSVLLPSCTAEQPRLDDVHAKISAMPDDEDIGMAFNYAQLLLEANVNQQYEEALQLADSVIGHLNAFYLKSYPGSANLISLYDEQEMTELDWWNQGFITDYQTIMQMRNEVAIAALALRQWNLYHYNNEVFNSLHKLSSQDEELAYRCSEIQQANSNRKTLIFLVITAIVAGALIYYFTYYKNHILPTFSLRQILELNRQIYNNGDERQLATIIRRGVNEVRRTNGVVLCLNKDTVYFSENCPQQEYMQSVIRDALQKKEDMVLDNGKTRVYTLDTQAGNCIGVIAFLLYDGNLKENDERVLRDIARYTAENIYYSSVRMERLNETIELIEDEKRRAEREANMVHVQNLVIDNTLSTIKHETMYYPNRIRQIVTNMRGGDGFELSAEVMENASDMEELTTYYKEVFTILADCAAKQINRPMFKRRNIPVADLLSYAAKVVGKFSKKFSADICFMPPDIPGAEALQVVADQTMIEYLIDNLVEALVTQKNQGTLALDFEKSEDFIMFAFSFDKLSKSDSELKTMFYPESLSYDPQQDRLNGAQMLIAKQIIREHDEHVRRGCRIFATHANPDGTGLRLSFSIPAARTPVT